MELHVCPDKTHMGNNNILIHFVVSWQTSVVHRGHTLGTLPKSMQLLTNIWLQLNGIHCADVNLT